MSERVKGTQQLKRVNCLPKKLEERRKKKKLKAEEEISPQEGSSEQNIETEEFFDTNEDLLVFTLWLQHRINY